MLFFTFDALRAGASRVTALSIALPIAYLLSESISATALLGDLVTKSAAIQTGFFIALTVALFVAFYRIVDTGSDSAPPLQALLTGVAGTAACMVVFLQLPVTTLPWTFGESCSVIFGEGYRLFWLLGAYFALAIARR